MIPGSVLLSPCPQFELGRVMASPKIMKLDLRKYSETLRALISMHSVCKWGYVGREEAEANTASVRKGSFSRVRSIHKIDAMTIWVVTDAQEMTTTIFFPEEYGSWPTGSLSMEDH